MSAEGSSSFRFFTVLVWLIFLSLLGLVLRSPSMNETVVQIFLGGLIGFLVSTCFLFRKKWRWILLIFFATVAGGVLIQPATLSSPQIFQATFAERVESYAGTPYAFGGQSRRGLDSQGLLRMSLVESYLYLALKEFNLGLIREAFQIWSNPFSLSAMVENHWLTRPAKTVESLTPEFLQTAIAGDVLIQPDYQDMVVLLRDQRVMVLNANYKRATILSALEPELPVFKSWFYWVRFKTQ